MKRDIFIMGKAGSGKDTVGEILREYYYKLFALADPIRMEYMRFFPDGNPRTDRGRMIDIGQTYKRLYGNDVWVQLLDREISGWRNVAITDGRYQVEYDHFVFKRRFLAVRVECPEEIRMERLLNRDGTVQEEALKKESQELWTAQAYVLDNSKDLDYLEKQMRHMMGLMTLGR